MAEHTGFGIASLVLGIIAIVTCILPLFILGLLAVIFGARAYWGESEDNYGLAGFILGIISMVVNTLVLLVLSWV